PSAYTGRTLIVTTRANAPIGGAPRWWVETFPDAETETLDVRHVDLQLDPDVLAAWSERVVQTLNALDEG
ncbi:MAG: hypothetical protein AAFQ85_07205, partial [Pseudomonadota bacterium]